MRACILAAAALLLPLCGLAAEPDAACQGQAQALLDTLLPFANQVAGKSLRVALQWDDATLSAASSASAEYLLAPTYLFFQPGADWIRLPGIFCTYSPAKQRVILAHELGHGIDRVTMPAFFGNTDQTSWPFWEQRPPEISATARALQIYRRAGFDTAEVIEVWPLSIYGRHVENAMQLQRERDNITNHYELSRDTNQDE